MAVPDSPPTSLADAVGRLHLSTSSGPERIVRAHDQQLIGPGEGVDPPAVSSPHGPLPRSPARQGLERMVTLTVEHLLLRGLEPGEFVEDDEIRTLAYDVYTAYDLKRQVFSMQALDAPITMPDEKFMAQARQDASEAFDVEWKKKPLGEFAVPANQDAKQRFDSTISQIHREGARGRFTVNVESFLRPGFATEAAEAAYKGLAWAGGEWTTGASGSRGAKLMERKALVRGRLDHEVCYSRRMPDEEGIARAAQQLAKHLQDPHDAPPLGMEPRERGVNYGEEHRYSVDAEGRIHPPFGFDENTPWPESFGLSRAWITFDAIRRALDDDDEDFTTLAERAVGKLDEALDRFGYDKGNPARINIRVLPGHEPRSP